jgi:CBS domain-containing protein
VLPEVRASEIARALKGASVSAILVVDDADRLVGVIDPRVLESAAPDETAAVLARRSPCIGESASLAEAVECMVRAHTRYLPVLRADGRVAGVLDDLDALRWIALHR